MRRYAESNHAAAAIGVGERARPARSAHDRSFAAAPGILERLFIWSCILEPMLFFVLFERSATGVTGNLSRILQVLVVFGLIVRAAFGHGGSEGRIRFPNFASTLYSNYEIYLLVALLASGVGVLSGAYDQLVNYDAPGASAVSAFVNSASVRPLIEYIIATYYFVYFVVLPQYLLDNDNALVYFFTWFRRMFIACLVVGALDFGAAVMGIGLVPRSISDGLFVGMRFHGLAGEPRDAFVYLFFGIAMLNLRAHYLGTPLRTRWVAVAVGFALLTQSASGLIGIIIFLVLYGLSSIGVPSARRMIQLVALIAIASALVYGAAVRSDRIMLYLHDASDLWYVLESGTAVPALIQHQMDNIYPIYDLTRKIRSLDLWPLIFGSGLGSSWAVNNRFAFGTNPQSQLVRTLYESGIVGTFFFVRAFTQPVKRLTRYLSPTSRHRFVLLTLLLLGCFFGHRSVTPFIYLGACIAVFRRMETQVAVRFAVLTPQPV